MKFKYLIEHEEPLDEGLVSWIKSKLRNPMDYWKANKKVLDGYRPVWTEKWVSPVMGDCEGVRFTSYLRESLRVKFADMGGDMRMVTGFDYTEYGGERHDASALDCPDYVCVFDKPVDFVQVFPIISRLFKEGRTGRDALRANGAMFNIVKGSPDKSNSVTRVFREFLGYWNNVGNDKAECNVLSNAIRLC